MFDCAVSEDVRRRKESRTLVGQDNHEGARLGRAVEHDQVVPVSLRCCTEEPRSTWCIRDISQQNTTFKLLKGDGYWETVKPSNRGVGKRRESKLCYSETRKHVRRTWASDVFTSNTRQRNLELPVYIFNRVSSPANL